MTVGTPAHHRYRNGESFDFRVGSARSATACAVDRGSAATPPILAPAPIPAPIPAPDARSAAGAAPQWTVSIVSHRQAFLCFRLLDDLARLAPPSLAKVILTINTPESELRPWPLPFELQVIHNSRSKGFGANHNHAFARCDTPYFAVLNPDLRIPRDPFPDLLRRLSDPAVGIVSPVVLEANGSVSDHARRLPTPGDLLCRCFIPGARKRRCATSPDWLAGAFLAFRTDVYRSLRGFDERFRLYCEDADLCARAQVAGLRIEVVQETSVVHLAQRTSRRRPQYLFWHLRSLMQFWGSPVYRKYIEILASRIAGGAAGGVAKSVAEGLKTEPDAAQGATRPL